MPIKFHRAEVQRAVEKHITRNLTRAAIVVQRQARKNAMVGGKAGFKTSRGAAGLVGSIGFEVKRFIARVGSNLVYARIHEIGGVIRPKTAKALHFVIDGQHIVVQSVTIPPRPYLRPALFDQRARVTRELTRPMPRTTP